MKSKQYSKNEIISITVLVGLFLYMLFAAGTKNWSSADETSDSLGHGYDIFDPVDAYVEYVPETDKGPCDIYIKFEGIDGEVQDGNHKKWCEVIEFDQAHIQVSGNSSGRGTPEILFDEIRIVKTIDKASPKLAEAVCRGTVYPTVEIEVTTSAFNTSRSTYLNFNLENVIVTSYTVGGIAQSENVPCEALKLSFEKITMTYTELDASGKSKGNVSYSWTID